MSATLRVISTLLRARAHARQPQPPIFEAATASRPQGAWQTEDQFSDGTYACGTTAAIVDAGGPLLLEEPELSLHPEVVRFLQQYFRPHAAAFPAIMTSTHSTESPSRRGDRPRRGAAADAVAGSWSTHAASVREVGDLLSAAATYARAVMPLTRPRAERLALFGPNGGDAVHFWTIEGPSRRSGVPSNDHQRGAHVHRVPECQHGEANLRRRLPGYNAAAGWSGSAGPRRTSTRTPTAGASWPTRPAPADAVGFASLFVEIEAWLLADAKVASFFRVKRSTVPGSPDLLPDAKATVVALAENLQSCRSTVAWSLGRRTASGTGVFVASRSSLQVASMIAAASGCAATGDSPSLARCVVRLDELIAHPPF